MKAALNLTCLIAVVAACACARSSAHASDTVHRVLIVSVDGMSPDLLMQAKAPAMHALIARGSYTMHARTIAEGYTVPSHVSMLTGVVPARHGVTWDHHVEDSYPNVPTIFELAKKAGYTTGLVAAKTKLIVLTKPGTLDWSYIANESREDDGDVVRHAAAMIREHQPQVMFVHFGGVDTVGHASGWGSAEQMAALERVDADFAQLQDAVNGTGASAATLTILTADHGGAGLLHPPEDPRSQFIPWVAAGPSVRRGFDLAQVPGLAISTMTTFATACAMLHIDVPEPIDATPVVQMIEQTSATTR